MSVEGRLIALPERWYRTVVDEIAIVEDHDPGDEDARSESTRRISQYARRADARVVSSEVLGPAVELPIAIEWVEP